MDDWLSKYETTDKKQPVQSGSSTGGDWLSKYSTTTPIKTAPVQKTPSVTKAGVVTRSMFTGLKSLGLQALGGVSEYLKNGSVVFPLQSYLLQKSALDKKIDGLNLQQLEEKTQQKLVDRIGEKNANSYLSQASQAVGQGVGQIAAFAIHPAIGYTTIAAQTINAGKQAYDEAYTATGDKKIASINGIVTGSVNALEALPFGRMFGIFKDILNKPIKMGAKNIAGRIIKSTLLESGTEGAQQYGQDVTAQLTYKKGEGEAFGKSLTIPLKDAIHATLVSIPTGILFGGVGEVSTVKRNNAIKKAKTEITNQFIESGVKEEGAKQIADVIVNQYAVMGDENVFEEEDITPFLKQETKEDEAAFKTISEPIFVRNATALENKSQTAKSRGYNTIPDKEGYEKVYMPYGKEGRGYYYSKKEEAFQKTTPKDELVSAQVGAEKIKQYKERLGIRFTTYIADKIYTGKKDGSIPEQAFGMYLDNTITLASAITKTTADHEVGHFVYRNMENIPLFEGVTREDLQSELKEKYGDKSSVDLEEHLMEDFEVYAAEQEANKPTTFTGKIKAFFEGLYQALKDMFSVTPEEKTTIQEFYDKLLTGKSKDVVTFENTGKASAFMEARYKEFGEPEEPMFKVSEKSIEDEYTKNIPTQETTEGRQTMKVIKQQMFPGKDKLTVSEQAQIKTRLKEQGKGFKAGEKTGIKIGKEGQKGKTDIQIAEMKREQELKTLREAIIKRSYTKSILNVLKDNIPRSEWATYFNRATQIGTSETKFSSLLESIYERGAEVQQEAGMRRDEAVIRSLIGYFKHVYDIEPSLILSIKKDLGIEKSVRKMDLVELLRVKEELKKRIQYRKDNPVVYLNYASLKKPTKKQMVAKAIDKIDKNFIAPIERKVKNISKPLYESLMTVFYQEAKNNQTDTENVKPLVDIFNKATPEDRLLITQKAQSADKSGLTLVLEKYATPEEVEVMLTNARESLDRIQGDLKEVGVEVPYRGFFFPRKMKPLEVAQADLMLKTFEYKMGKKATEEEKTQIMNNLLRGFNISQMPFITLSGKRFEAHRMLETIPTELLPFYEDFATALQNYIASANAVIEQRKFFGKTVIETLNYDANLEQSIGAKVNELLEKKIITIEQTQEIKDTLQTLFVYKLGPTERVVQQFTNDYIYPLTLGQLTSTFSQIKDLSMQTLMDIFSGQFNMIGKQTITKEDINLSESIAELESATKTSENRVAQLGKKVMTPFGKADAFFLTTFINASYKRSVKLAKRDSPRFRKEMTDIFGEEKANDIIKKLKSKTGNEKGSELPEEMKRFLYSEVAKLRPITKLQKTRAAIRHPAFYTLRNFMIKQLEFVRVNSLDYISEGVKNNDKKQIAEGIGRFVAIMSYMALLGAGVDELKDWILGKTGDRSFWDKMFDNILQVFGMNTYMINMAQQKGIGAQFITSYSPAALSISGQIIDEAVKDISGVIGGDSVLNIKSIKRFPLIGNIYYNQFGGASD